MRKLFSSLFTRIFVTSLFTISLTGCGEEAPTFSLLPAGDVFYQNGSELNNKLDIVFVIDNSLSMQEEQDNMAANFNAFITDFITKGYDYKIAVAATDSWLALFGQSAKARFRDGKGTTHSGYRVIDILTPNPIDVFAINVNIGVSGTGDERAFQSFKTALLSDLNTGFRRDDAYLSIIIVSDEDDFSWDGSSSLNQNYNDSRIHSVQSYVDWLDQYTQSTGAMRRYSVSTIAVTTPECRDLIGYNVLGTRYMELANATDGIIGDICSPSFADSLNEIQTHIAELSTQFFLSRIPRVETIVVYVNNAVVPQDATNGWTYNSEANSIVFHGTAIPPQGAVISIDFEPFTSL